jgi:hypothetical protein
MIYQSAKSLAGNFNLVILGFGHDDQKFFATHTGNQIDLLQINVQTVGHFEENRISCNVSVVIIVAFHLAHIHYHDRAIAVICVGLLEHSLNMWHGIEAVEQTSQGLVIAAFRPF